jgi:hypothetical protein
VPVDGFAFRPLCRANATQGSGEFSRTRCARTLRNHDAHTCLRPCGPARAVRHQRDHAATRSDLEPHQTRSPDLADPRQACGAIARRSCIHHRQTRSRRTKTPRGNTSRDCEARRAPQARRHTKSRDCAGSEGPGATRTRCRSAKDDRAETSGRRQACARTEASAPHGRAPGKARAKTRGGNRTRRAQKCSRDREVTG